MIRLAALPAQYFFTSIGEYAVLRALASEMEAHNQRAKFKSYIVGSLN